MGIFGRSRANTTNGAISQPVLTFSDAAPRDDLQVLENRSHTLPASYTARSEKPMGIATSNGRGLRQRPQKNVIQAFDFTITEPPEMPLMADEPAGVSGGLDVNAIGIALGSPSMMPPPQYQPAERTSSPFQPEKQDHLATTASNTETLKRKPSKWKKIGDMLKGSKQSDAKREREGFYQLGLNKSQHESLPAAQNPDHKQPTFSFSSEINNDRWDDRHQETTADSLLAVNIPTVQMERYSVMFRSVLGEKPSSNLLARRSKALNHLYVDGMQPGLQLQKPQRRATSPSLNRSSTYTLFPGAPQNETNVNEQDQPAPAKNGLAPRSPIRSNTFPRSRRTNNHDNNLTVPDLTPALSTGASSAFSAGYSSAEASPIPFETPVTARDYINPKSEPVWEMITSKKSSDSPEGIRPSMDAGAVVSKFNSTSTVTMPLMSHEQRPAEGQKTRSATTKPLAASRLPPRKESLHIAAAHADRPSIPRFRSNYHISKTHEERESLLPETHHQHHAAAAYRETAQPKLHRSQTMPLPLNIAKKPSTPQQVQQTQQTAAAGTPLLQPSSSISTDSLLVANNDSRDTSSFSQTPSPLIPQTIEISIARSVSVSRRIIPRQTLVPLGADPQVFFHNENERFGDLTAQKKVPVLIDVSSPASSVGAGGSSSSSGGSGGSHHYIDGQGNMDAAGLAVGVRGVSGHRYQKSQDIIIESA